MATTVHSESTYSSEQWARSSTAKKSVIVIAILYHCLESAACCAHAALSHLIAEHQLAFWINAVVKHYDGIALFSVNKPSCPRKGTLLLWYCAISVSKGLLIITPPFNSVWSPVARTSKTFHVWSLTKCGCIAVSLTNKCNFSHFIRMTVKLKSWAHSYNGICSRRIDYVSGVP